MNHFTLRSYQYERPKHQKGSSFWVSRFFTLAATVIVLLVHGIWLFVAAIQPPFQMAGGEFGKPVMSYMSDFRSRSISDVQLVRSPILMSLPTSVGFSGPLLGKASMTRPPAFNEKPAEFFGNPDQPFQVEPYGKSLKALKELVLDQRLQPMPGRLEDQSGPQKLLSQPEMGLTVYWMDQRSAEPIEIASVADGWGKDPWIAVLFVCLRDNGLVSRALLENPSPDMAVNINLLRAVRGTTFDRWPDGGCGRLMIRYHPAVTEEKGS